MNHLSGFDEIVHESVETTIIEADDQECIDCTDGVIGLSFFYVGVIGAYKSKRLDDLDVVEVAN